MTGLLIIVFACVFVVSCDNKGNNGNKVAADSKKDSVATNVQKDDATRSMDMVY